MAIKEQDTIVYQNRLKTPGNFTALSQLINFRQQNGAFSFQIKTPTFKYFDQAVKLKCFVDFLKLELFPNGKEITESFAIYNAVTKHLCKLGKISLSFPDVNLVAIGDGSTPRTAATFAFRSAWKCYSIDPVMNLNKKRWNEIDRLKTYKNKIQDLNLEFEEPTIIVMPHAHVYINDVLDHIKAPIRHLVVNPCCHSLGSFRQPDIDYDDWGIWSPERNIMVWKYV